MSPIALIAAGAVSTVAIVGAALLVLRMSTKDMLLAARVQAAQGSWPDLGRGVSAQEERAANALGIVRSIIGTVGRWIMLSGLLPGKTRAELQSSLAASGFRGPNVLALFLGSKLILLAGLPTLAWLLAGYMDIQGSNQTIMIVVGAVVGLIAPDNIVGRMRKASIKRLETGLPDALDLMVICAQAGLSLNPAMARVVDELRVARPDIARELDETSRELEMVADASVALGNLGRRTGVDSLKRLASTLVQTIQYGTPLGEALRTLSNELRQQTLTRYEERAARLPVLLTMPMIIFILPCVFIVVAGPAVMTLSKTLGN